MNRKISLGAAVSFMLVVAGLTFCITMIVSLNHFNQKVFNVKNREEMYKKLADVDAKVRQNFDGTIDEEYLQNSVAAGYVRGLNDKYSTYLTKDEHERKQLDNAGKLVGVGASIVLDDSGYVKINEVYKDSPAELGGIQKYDLLVSINDVDIINFGVDKVDKLLRDKEGTKVKIAYHRDGVNTVVDLVRKDIEIPFVTYSLLEKNGYIKISTFNKKAEEQFEKAIDELIKKGANGLILDLRNNNGGIMESATNMLNMLLPQGVLATSKNNKGVTTNLAYSDSYEVALPIATIANKATASAAELFVATLRDFKKANSVGTITFGKGVLQTLVPLIDGSAISVTTAEFFPPSGEAINGVGVKPDYEIKLTPEQEKSFNSLTPATDPQILKAIEIVNSKKAE